MIEKTINDARKILANLDDDAIIKILINDRLTGVNHRLTDCVIILKDTINEKLYKK